MSSYFFLHFMEQKRRNANKLSAQNRFYSCPGVLNSNMSIDKKCKMRNETLEESRVEKIEDGVVEKQDRKGCVMM